MVKIVKITPTNGSLNGSEYVLVRGCRWNGSSFNTYTEEICNTLTTNFTNGYKVALQNNEIQISLHTVRIDANNVDKTDAFNAVPWKNVEVIVKTSSSGAELGRYNFKWNSGTNSNGGIFPRVQSAYGQCVWWSIKRFWETKGKEIWAPFYKSDGRTKIGQIIAGSYVPKQYDVLIGDYPSDDISHYAFIEKVDDIGTYQKVYISEYNVIQEKYSECILLWQEGKWKTTNGYSHWCQFNWFISSPERW